MAELSVESSAEHIKGLIGADHLHGLTGIFMGVFCGLAQYFEVFGGVGFINVLPGLLRIASD